MRRLAHPLFTAVLAGAAALFALSALGVAAAEAPTTAPVARTVNVAGVAVAPIPVNADASTASGVYHEAMVKAVSDAQTKAGLLASASGTTPGSVDELIERGGYIECSAPGNESASYEGEQPDFGTDSALPSGVYATPDAASSAPSKPSHRPKAKKKLPTAKPATATSCNLTAEVAVVYSIA